jgi:hypothetical protein
VWEAIDEWFSDRTQMNPPRIKDLLNPRDQQTLDFEDQNEDPEEEIDETNS